jgi:hypothetical protein
MKASLKALLSGAIDYAGIFPPAKLPLDEAFRNYLRYRQEPESWMLGRFICPAQRLAELVPLAAGVRADAPVHISALSQVENNQTDRASLRDDLTAIQNFQQKMHERGIVDVMEIRLPALTPQDVFAVVKRACGLIESHEITLTPYFEVLDAANTATGAVAGISLAELKRAGANQKHCKFAGFKLRCGGVAASAFPSPELIAQVIAVGRDADVPLKFTAGLHHPLRRRDPELNVHMHGFLNVFVAGVLAYAQRLELEAIHEILVYERAKYFEFDEFALQWRNYVVDLTQIKSARLASVTSFGSCSFDEPRDDLRALGLL